MATLVAKAIRNEEARARLEAGLERVARRLGVEIPPPAPTRLFDQDLVPILEIERFADFVDRVDSKLEELATDEEAPAGREEWTMEMLRAYAKEQDIVIPGDVRKKVDIAAYIEAVEAERKASDEASADSSEGDSPDASPDDAAAREGEDAGAAEGSGAEPMAPELDRSAGNLEPGTGTVRVEPDGSQTIVEPREGSDQQPGDRVPSTGQASPEEDSE